MMGPVCLRACRKVASQRPWLERSGPLGLLLALLCTAISPSTLAATERYDYDALGRLIRHTSAQGQVTEYVYDPAGNILEVRAGSPLSPPTITGVTPSFIRRGQRNQVQISGTAFIGVTVRSTDPSLLLSGLVVAPTSLGMQVEVPLSAPLGPRTFEVRNSAGQATTTLEVIPALELSLTPTPIALPADGVDRRFTLSVNDPTPFAQTLSLSVLDPSVLRVGSATVSLPANAVGVDVRLAGLSSGSTQFLVNLVSGQTPPSSFLAIVGSDAAAINVSRSAVVGLARGDPTSVPAGVKLQGFAASVGVARGDPTQVPAGTKLQSFASSVGVSKGDPTTVPPGQPVGPVVARPIGINRQ